MERIRAKLFSIHTWMENKLILYSMHIHEKPNFLCITYFVYMTHRQGFSFFLNYFFWKKFFLTRFFPAFWQKWPPYHQGPCPKFTNRHAPVIHVRNQLRAFNIWIEINWNKLKSKWIKMNWYGTSHCQHHCKHLTLYTVVLPPPAGPTNMTPCRTSIVS